MECKIARVVNEITRTHYDSHIVRVRVRTKAPLNEAISRHEAAAAAAAVAIDSGC